MHFRGHFKGIVRGFHGGMRECFRVLLGGVLGWFRGGLACWKIVSTISIYVYVLHQVLVLSSHWLKATI